MAGEITALGVGSGLPLSDMLEQLREVDDVVVNMKNEELEQLTAKLEEFTVSKNNLLNIKSKALDLSLESTFLKRGASSSDEKVLSVSVMDGAQVQSVSLEVENLAGKSSWKSTDGFGSAEAIVYVPKGGKTSQTAAGTTEAFVENDGVITISYGSEGNSLTLNVSAGDSIGQLVNTINGADLPLAAYAVEEDGGRFSFYVRHEDEGYGEDYRVDIDGGETGLTFAAPEAEFTYQVGDESKTIKVAGDTTLQGMADLINGELDNLNVTAKIINSGVGDTPYRFILQADNTGEENRISFQSQLLGLVLEEDNGIDPETGEQVSLNANFTLDGIHYQRQTNSVADVWAGVTLALEGEGTASISITNDDSRVEELIAGLVDDYNTALQEIKADVGYDAEEKKFGLLADTQVRGLTSELQGMISTIVGADTQGNITSMLDLGMEFQRDGTVALNTATLDSALAANREDVTEFFLGDVERGITGFGDRLNDKLRSLTGGLGMFEVGKTTTEEKIRDLKLTIESETARLDKRYELLTQQFVQLDRYMREMTSLGDYLAGQFDSLSDGWSSGKK